MNEQNFFSTIVSECTVKKEYTSSSHYTNKRDSLKFEECFDFR